jgi:hypothetical protein
MKKINKYNLNEKQKEVLQKLEPFDMCIGLAQYMLNKHGIDATNWESVRGMCEYILILLQENKPVDSKLSTKKLNITDDAENF